MNLVTGSTGFLGVSLARALIGRGERVRMVGRSSPPPDLLAAGVEWFHGDLSDPGSLKGCARNCSAVFHTAAKVGVWGARGEFFRVNVGGTDALLEEARAGGVNCFVHTSTPSVVYNGQPLRGVDETLPLTNERLCPAAYPVSKARAEERVLAANSARMRTAALRPHLIWGPGDRHLVPRVVARARSGRLRIVGDGSNRVDLVHIANCVQAHLDAREALLSGVKGADGRAYFITNGEPVPLWEFVNRLLGLHGIQPVTRRVPLAVAHALGGVCEALWGIAGRKDDPPMTRFVAKELATDHWFSIEAARTLLGYAPQVTMEEGLALEARNLLRSRPSAAARAAQP